MSYEQLAQAVSELAAVNTALSETAAQTVEASNRATDAAVALSQGTVMVEAPINEKTYARKNRSWVALPDDTEYWDMSVYLASVDLGPGNRVIEQYPRLNLSRPVLTNCFVRRADIASENLTLLLKPTSGTDWTATCVIPAGQHEGFFTSNNAQALDSTQGFYIMPSPIPTESVDGLAITLRFEIEVEQTMSMLSVPQPMPVDTLVTFGQHGDPAKPSFSIRKLDTSETIPSSDTGGNISGYLNTSVSGDGSLMVYVKANSDLIGADLRTGLTTFSKLDAITRVGASLSSDGTHLLTAELRSGKWYAVEYNVPAMTVYKETDLSLHGVTTLNSIKYSPNDRYLLVGHAAGSLVLNVLTGVPLVLQTPPAGAVLDVDMTASIYAVLSRKVDDFSLHITTNGQLMTHSGDVDWNEITATGFNWFTDVPSPYPYFVVAGQTSEGWQVVPYAATDYAYEAMPWRINFGERIVGVAFSEATQVEEQVTESTYGRAIAVFGEHGYKVYDLATGIEVAATSVTAFATVKGGFWKFVKGIYE